MNDFTTTLVIITAVLILANLLVSLLRKQPDHSSGITTLKEMSSNGHARIETLVRDEAGRNRMELSGTLKQFSETSAQQTDLISKHQFKVLERVSASLNNIGETVSGQLQEMQKDNNAQLEKMRGTVEEKLDKTLETRLGKSFEQVRSQLEAVHKGLGEMRNLATGVGDLQRTLSNVKSRGILGEMQLANILEDIFTVEQYASNVCTKPGTSSRVEFAIRLPGKEDGSEIWLPIDSKLPQDRYSALTDAYEVGDKATIEAMRKQLSAAIRLAAKDISSKYINPPHTTDFAILFLPFEGLYSEVMRIPGFMEELRSSYKVLIAGPSNLSAFLSSLLMGFRTLAIEKRSSEVWGILGAVKSEFGKFENVLGQVQKKLDQASGKIRDARVRTRAIERQLRAVEELPQAEARQLLGDGLEVSHVDHTEIPEDVVV